MGEETNFVLLVSFISITRSSGTLFKILVWGRGTSSQGSMLSREGAPHHPICANHLPLAASSDTCLLSSFLPYLQGCCETGKPREELQVSGPSLDHIFRFLCSPVACSGAKQTEKLQGLFFFLRVRILKTKASSLETFVNCLHLCLF